MIDAGQVVGMAASLQTNEITAMGAAVDHCVNFAVIAASDDDRCLAEKGGQVIPRLRQLAGECQILPGRPQKDSIELGVVDLRIGEHPIGHPRIALGGPFDFWLHGGPHFSLAPQAGRGLG